LNNALRQRFRRVHEDELLPLLLLVTSDEGHDADGEALDVGRSNCGNSLLSVDDPPGAVRVSEFRAHGDDERANASVFRVPFDASVDVTDARNVPRTWSPLTSVDGLGFVP